MVKKEHDLDLDYGTVYAWVRYRLGAKSKIPRPQSYKQDEEIISEFKKTRYYTGELKETISTR